MAFEFKTMDIANEAETYFIELYGSFGWRLKSSQRVFNRTARPVATIGNGSVNYVQTQTETVDFTKLVFERDTNMENYERLYSLESQYFALQSMMPEKEPEYSSTIEIAEWAEKRRPNVAVGFNDTRFFWLIALGVAVITIVVLDIISVSNGDPSLITILINRGNGWFTNLFFYLMIGAFFGGILGFIGWSIVTNILQNKALKKALNDPLSAERAELERQYQKMHTEAVSYGEKKARMILIIAEATKLVK